MNNRDQAALWEWLQKETGLKREIGVGDWVWWGNDGGGPPARVLVTDLRDGVHYSMASGYSTQFPNDAWQRGNPIRIPREADWRDVIIKAGEKLGRLCYFATIYDPPSTWTYKLNYIAPGDKDGDATEIWGPHYPTATDALAALAQELKVRLEEKNAD